MLSPALLVLQALAIAPSEPGARFVYGQPLGVRLFEARLQDVERALGPSATESRLFICYVAPHQKFFVRFFVSGVDRQVTGFTMRRLIGETAAPCGALPPSAPPLDVGGVALGMSRAAVIELLGPGPESSTEAFRHFVFNNVLALVVHARFENDHLVELSVQGGPTGSPTPIRPPGVK